MKSILFACILLLLSSLKTLSQPADAVVIIRQSTLNGFLDAIGPVSGTDNYNVLGQRGQYRWTLRNARIELHPNQARFIADADVHAGPFSYGSKAAGDVEVLYHPEVNRISIRVLHAVFEVYIKVFGAKIHITNIDAARFYKPEFEFAGPQPIQASVDVALPDGTKKTIFIKPVSQDLHIEEDQITVASRLVFADHPIPDVMEHQGPLR